MGVDGDSCRARFGPYGIRKGSRRMGTNHLHTDVNIRLTDHLEIVDCGDVREYPRLLLSS